MITCKDIEFPDPIPADRDTFCSEVARLLAGDADGLRVDNIEPGHPWRVFAHLAFARADSRRAGGTGRLSLTNQRRI